MDHPVKLSCININDEDFNVKVVLKRRRLQVSTVLDVRLGKALLMEAL
jgi:hypothetical protein